jgi:hypothetical protein
MSLNPLQQYFRQPKIYIQLPSKGVFNKPGTVQGDVTNLPVYGMTGMDEIIIKTPDALMTGESTVKVITSCCPSVKDAWDLNVLDTEMIFTAIRIATFGNNMGVTHSCPGCQAENEYDIDLTKIIDHLSTCQYNNKVILDDLIIKIQPLTYKQGTDLNIKNFALQQTLFKSDGIEDEAEKQKILDDLWKQIGEVQTEVYMASVESIDTPTVSVTERNFIIEYLRNCDKSVFDAIKKQIDLNKDLWKFDGFAVKCDTCSHEAKLTIELDPSTFFVTA